MSEPVQIVLIIGAVVLLLACLAYLAARQFFGGLRKTAVELPKETADAALDVARRTAAVLKETFKLNPRVISENTIVFGATRDVLELAVLEKSVRVNHQFAEKWCGSSKTIQVTAEYTVKIGYDLRKNFHARVESGPGAPRLLVNLPMPEVLSIQQRHDTLSMQEDNGLWNRITDADRSNVLRQLNGLVEAEVTRLELLQNAERQTRTRLIDELHSALEGAPTQPRIDVISNPPLSHPQSPPHSSGQDGLE